MSKLRMLLIGGVAVGILAGGSVALFTGPSSTTGSITPPTTTEVPAKPTTPPLDQAAAYNQRGRGLLFAGKYMEASSVFRQAVALVPEPKYFFNLGNLAVPGREV